MKNKDVKKGKESIIGKIIYGFLLFMPLLAIATTCLYAIFNKNAYQSYSNFNVTEENYVNVTDYTLIEGRTYKYISNNLNSADIHTADIYCTNVKNLYCTRDLTSYDLNTIQGFNLYTYNNNTILHFIASPTIPDIAFSTHYLTFEFDFMSYARVNQSNDFSYYFDSMIYENEVVNVTNTLDNVFYYAVNRVEQSNLFNWATNSIIYTGISNTCTQLSITNTFIPLLLAYWLIISIIYILYDIILMILIVLHNRIHRLQDSMS